MQIFEHTLARVAVWNLAGFGGIDAARMKRQAEGLALLDAELVVLVEVNPVSYIDDLATEIGTYGLHYDTTIVAQPGNLHIGFLHKKGVAVTNAQLVPGSEGDYAGGRRAVSADIKMGKFSAHLLGVHLKSGRDKPEQK
ncbi:MAG: GMP synthase, partial [Pseudomonadota bacterium]